VPRILIVEDDYDTSLALSTELRGAGFEVVIAGDGPTALQRAQPDISLVLLDIRLPKKDGWWVLEEIRKSDKQTPIMMLTSLGREDDVVRGLDRGANDYLTKPFRKKELLARIHALIRRTDGPEDTVFSFGNVQGDLARRKVHVDGITVELTSLEWKFLEAFLKSKGRLLRACFINTV
jgi:DNA-binding response OmpR family regulator